LLAGFGDASDVGSTWRRPDSDDGGAWRVPDDGGADFGDAFSRSISVASPSFYGDGADLLTAFHSWLFILYSSISKFIFPA
jgi:hypothetical protein